MKELEIIITVDTLEELAAMVRIIEVVDFIATYDLLEIPKEMVKSRIQFQRAIVYCKGKYRGEFYFEDIRLAEDYEKAPLKRWRYYNQVLGKMPEGVKAQLIFGEWVPYEPLRSFYVARSQYD